MTDNLPRNKFNWKTVTGITLAVLGITILYGLTVSYFFEGNWQHSGPFGDTFGLLTSLFSGASLIGVIATVYLQTKELEAQRKEIKASRIAQQSQAEHQLKAAKINAIQTQINLFSENMSSGSRGIVSKNIYQDNPENVLCSLLEKLEELTEEPREKITYLDTIENREYVITHPRQHNLDLKIKIADILDDGSTKLAITHPVGSSIQIIGEKDKAKWLDPTKGVILSQTKRTHISLPNSTLIFKVSGTKERSARIIHYSIGEFSSAS